MPPRGPQVLFPVRERRRLYPRLPSAAGKRRQGRGHRDRSPVLRIRYNPRPHIDVPVGDTTLTALLDSGSEGSFVSTDAAERLHGKGYTTIPVTGRIYLADGSSTPVETCLVLPVVFPARSFRHEFRVLPGLDVDMLIGVDVMARARITIPPPPLHREEDRPPRAAVRPTTVASTEPAEDARLQAFLAEELPKFDRVRGPTDRAEHVIRVKNHPPIKQRYRPRNPAMQAIIDHEVDEMIRAGVIEPSRSAWSSPIVIVRKKDGKPRFCIDFRRVNEVTERDAYPLPQIPATLDKLRGARYLSTIDLMSGYWQIPLAPASRPVTAFTVPGRGLMQFKVMPFGLHSAPATFQRLLDDVLGPELEPRVFVYLDDIIVVTRTFDEHLATLREVFRRLREARLRPNTEKCRFCTERLKYLGHVVDRDGIRTDPEKTEAIANWPEPQSVRQIRQFLGLASWYRRFIRDFATVAAPLTALTRKNARWSWGNHEQAAFEALKTTLTSAPVLACPDFERQFVLQTDASTTGLGAVLTQYFPEGERVIAYASRTLNNAERNYSATELECLAVLWGIRRMRDYLEGYRFKVVTDHQSLRWLQKLDSPTGRLGRWAFELRQFDFEVQYRKGSLNKVADALSRRTAVNAAANTACAWYRKWWDITSTTPDAAPDFRIADGRLYRHVLHTLDFADAPNDAQWKECVPRENRAELLQRYHDAPTAGHLGTAKTIARIARHFYWPGMFREISRYVRQCRTCLAHKPEQRRPAGLLHPTDVSQPWQQVTIDLVGPLPRSSQGHTWLLTMQDRFTKWLEMRALRRATAANVATALTKAVILRHGCPEEIWSDNGTQLRSATLTDLLRALQIRHRLTPAYAPHCNPVERTNRTVKTMIRQYLHRDHRKWDERLAELQFAYNTATHDATGHTPAFLNHGRELRRPEERAPAGPPQRPHALQRRLRETYALVRIQLARAFQRQQQYYNLRRREWRPKRGDWVWKRDHPLSRRADAFNAKLAPKYVGPLEVRRIISPVIYDLRSAGGKWYRHVHVQDLKPAPAPTEETGSDTDDDDDDAACGALVTRPASRATLQQKQHESTATARGRDMAHDGILAEIAELLGEAPEPYDPARPEIERPPKPRPPPDRGDTAATRPSQSTPPSSAGRSAPIPWLRGPPPPVPQVIVPRGHRPQPTLEPDRVMGPEPPPPITVEVTPGTVVDVPYFAVHVSRAYTARVRDRRWRLRFDRTGRLRSSKEIRPPPKDPKDEFGL
ncbi:uncharacterized protein K02A2.6-like [Solenopsis invicta]|uniref:uncharacterized protein K02A2.6-like n=1 Tax=Solenopsis invicta TaxID=13686 RepID=UPI00193D130F|nr:uncharacterized protein K02A2.6-like [Solenopsis invicta]